MTAGVASSLDTVGPTFAPNARGGAYNTAATVANAFRVTVNGAKLFSGSFTLYGYTH